MSYTSTKVEEIKFYNLPDSIYQEMVQNNEIEENSFYMTTGTFKGENYVSDETLFIEEYDKGTDGSSSTNVSPISVTLLSSNWNSLDNTQKVEINGISSTSMISVSPHPDSLNEYGDNQIYASSLENNFITFKCRTVPSSNITVNILLFS